MSKEDMEEQFNKEAKQGGRFASTHQEESPWQSTATWERLWEQKKVRLHRSQAMKEGSPKHG